MSSSLAPILLMGMLAADGLSSTRIAMAQTLSPDGGSGTASGGAASTGGGGGGGGGGRLQLTTSDNLTTTVTGAAGGAGGGENASGSTGGGGTGTGGTGGAGGGSTGGTGGSGGGGAVGGAGTVGIGSNGGLGGGGGGGAAIILNGSSLIVSSSGVVTGGTGGSGGSANSSFSGNLGNGGGGGSGLVSASTGLQVSNNGTLAGGAGGSAGFLGFLGSGATNGLGGAGGAGVSLSGDSASFANTATVRGGAGGLLNTINSFTGSGTGGAGGTGLIISGASGTVDNSGTIRGGAGGYDVDSNASTGGASGAGVILSGSGTSLATGTVLTNAAAGTIVGADRDALFATSGPDNGGAGVSIVGNYNTLDNAGTITGGSAGSAGVAGVVVTGSNNLVISSGTITGGSNARSVLIDGNDNTLELRTGYVLGGGARVNGTGGTLALGGTSDAAFDLARLGSGANGFDGFSAFSKTGASTWTLNGISTGTTDWDVRQGTLAMASSAELIGNVSVASGAKLSVGGLSRVHGALTIADGGTLAATTGATTSLTIDDLYFSPNSILDMTVTRAGSSVGLATASSNLTLDGTLNIVDSGASLTAGTYRLFNVIGTMTNNTMVIGTAPIQYTYALEFPSVFVNLIVAPNVGYWNGGQTSPNGAVNGGGGTWTSSVTNWADATGATSKAWGGYEAVFQGAPGTVTVDPAGVSAYVLRFGVDGYTVGGGTLNLSSIGAAKPIVDVATAASATIQSVIAGTAGLDKTGNGRLILGGANTFTGPLSITAGTLQVGDGTAGSILAATDIANGGMLTFNQGADASLSGVISGAGSVTKMGPTTLTLTGANTYSGTTHISGGVLQVTGTGTLGTGSIVNNGALVLDATPAQSISAIVSGTGSLTLSGAGGLTLSGANTYTGATTVSAGTLTVSNAAGLGAVSGGTTVASGATLSLTGSITIGAEALTLSGSGVSGAGALASLGSGAKSFQGAITLAADSRINVMDSSTLNLGGGIAGSNHDLTLGGTSNNSGNVTGVISGTGSVTKTDSVQWSFSGANTYTGLTTVSSGILYVTNSLGLGSTASGTVVASGASLGLGSGVNIAGEDLTISGTGKSNYGAIVSSGNSAGTYGGAITLAANSQINAGLLTIMGTLNVTGGIGGAGQTLTLAGPGTGTVSGVIATGTGGVTKINAGSWSLTGDNTYTGTTTVSAGTLSIGNGGATGSIAGNVAVASGTGLTFNRSSDLSYGGVISGGGTATKLGAGTLTLTGLNTLTGKTTVSAGRLQLGGGGNAGALGGGVDVQSGATFSADLTGASAATVAGTLSIKNGGTLQALSGTTLTANGLLELQSSATLSVTLGAPSTIAAISAGSLTLDGTLDVTATTGFASGTYRLIDYGTLVADNGLVLGTIPNEVLVAIDTSTANQVNLLVTGSQYWNGTTTGTVGPVAGGSGTWTANGATTNWTNAAGTLATAWDGGIAVFTAGNTGDTVTVDGAGVTAARLAFRSNGYTLAGGTMTLAALGGQPQIGVDGGLEASIASELAGTQGLEKTGVGTLILTGANSYSGGTTISSGTLQLGDGGTAGTLLENVANNGGLVFNRSDAVTFAGDISGTGEVRTLGGGTLTLSGSNTYGGATTVSAGTLALSGGSAIGDQSAVTVASGAMLTSSAAETIGSLAGTGNVAIDSFPLTVGGNNGSTTFSGVVSGTAGLVKAGTGTMTLGGINTNTGGTTVSAGRLIVSSGAALSNTASVLVATGATLELTTADETTGAIASGGAIVLNANTLTVGGGGADGTFSGTISGTGGLTKIGNGQQSLTGTNSFAGALQIFAGTLVVQNGSALGDQSAVTVGSGGVFGLTGSETIGSLAGAGSVRTNATGTLTTGGNDGSTLFSGVIRESAGAMSLVKTGTGTMTLSGTNTYSGGTTISGGRLQLGDGGTAGSILGDVTNDGTLAFNRSDNLVYSNVVSGTGSLIQAGNGRLILDGANTYTGGTTVQSGTLEIGNGGTTGSIIGPIVNNGTLVFNRSDDMTAPGTVTGTGGLEQRGSGTLTLVGANSAGAGTEIVSGTLELLGGVTLASDVAVGFGATLKGELGGTAGGVIDGAVSVLNGGTLLAAPTTTGGTYGLTMSSLSLDDNAVLSVTLGSNAGNAVFSAGTLALDGVLDVTAAGSMSLGVYRILNYTTLASDGGMRVGTTPTGFAYEIQQQAGQVNLALLDGDMLYWNGSQVSSDGTIHGGNGTWAGNAGAANWLTSPLNQSNAWNDRFAVFAGTAGTATIDATAHGPVSTTGVQFMVDGYTVEGDTLTLAAASGRTQVRVGDGTPSGSAYEATIASVIAGTTGLEKTDLGTLVLTGANTYAGGTKITRGTLQVGQGGTSGSILGDVLNDAALAFDRVDDSLYAGNISGTGTLAKAGGGTLTLTGTNSYSGATTIQAGLLRIGGGSSLSDSAGLQIAAGARLELLDASETIGGLSGAGSVALNGHCLTVAGGGGYSGNLSGAGCLTKTGSGVLTLSGVNSYGGGTTVTDGTLQIAGTGGLGLGDLALRGSASLRASETFSFGGGVALAPVSGSGGGTFDIDAAKSLTLAGTMSGLGALEKTGAGTLVLSGSNSYGGGTTISEGTVQIAGAGALGSGAVALKGPGILRASETFAYTGAISLTPVGGTGSGALGVDDAKTLTLTGAVSGQGDLKKIGGGTLVLGGANVYGGTTDAAAGALVVTGGQAIGDTGSVSVASAAQFVVRGDETIGSIAGSGSIVLDGARLTTGGDNASNTYSGDIGGTGGLTKSGTGTLSLSGAGTYSGDTVVAGGGLSVAGTLSGDVHVQNLATLSGGGVIDGTVNVLDGGTLSAAMVGGLTMGGLDLASAANLDVKLDAPGGNAILNVNGNARLDGTLNVAAASGFGLGVYRILNYTGTLTDNGMDVTGPTGGLVGGLQLSVSKQVNLFVENSTSAVSFWNGANVSATQAVVGGSGTWTANAQRNWINASGTVPRSWNSDFAVFQGTAATVTVDNAAAQVSTTGMQFAQTGYVVAGGALQLTDSGSAAAIRVGDGTLAGATTIATISSSLIGTAGLEKTDFGTLILTGDNIYTGGTTVSGGRLQIGNGGTTGAILGNISNNAGLAFDRSDDTTVSGAISGTGSLTKLGAGILSLRGTNTYSGGTSIQAGTLKVSSASALGTGDLALKGAATLRADDTFTIGSSVSLAAVDGAGGGTFEVDADKTLTLSGSVSGIGGLVKRGDGLLVLDGTGSYMGLTTISAGTLQIGNGGTVGSVAGDILNNASLVFDRSDTYAFTGAITGTGGVAFAGGGTVLFSSPYEGPISVFNSNLELLANSSSNSPFTVNAGGVLGGAATIGGLTVNSGGTAAPGYSPGTLVVNGPIAFNSGSVYAVDVTPAGAHDLITATGPVTLSSGASVQVLAVPGTYGADSSYAILTTTDTLTGRFGTVSSDYAFLLPELTYDPQNVYLKLSYTGADFAAFAETRNQMNVAVAAQALGSGTPLFDAIIGLPGAAVAPAFDQISGEIYASTQTALQQQSLYLRDAVGTRMRQSSTGAATTALSAAAEAAGPTTARDSQGLTPTVWLQGYGGWGRIGGNGNAASVSASAGGLLGGLDVDVGDHVRLGMVAGYGQSWLDSDLRSSSASVDTYDIGFYADSRFGALAVRGGGSYSRHDVSTARDIGFPGFSGSNGADYRLGTTQLFAEGAYDVSVGDYAFEPFAGLAYVDVSGDSVTEGGSVGSALSVDIESQETFYSTLGLRAATSFDLEEGTIVPSLTLGWQHAFGDTTPSADMLFDGGAAPFQVRGTPTAENVALIGLGVAYRVSDQAEFKVNYTGEIAKDTRHNTFGAQFSLNF